MNKDMKNLREKCPNTFTQWKFKEQLPSNEKFYSSLTGKKMDRS